MSKQKPSKPTSAEVPVELEQQVTQHLAQQAAAHNSEALVKQDPLPKLTIVKNKDGSERLAARQAGKFTRVANASALEIQKIVLKALNRTDKEGVSKLETVVDNALTVAAANTDPRNNNATAGLLETLDEISGSKDARKAMTKTQDTSTMPKIIFMNFPDVKQMENRPQEKTQPSWITAEVIVQNAAPIIVTAGDQSDES